MRRTRLERLERDLAAVSPAPACPECGRPLGAHDMVILVDEDGNSLQPTCGACGLRIDASGRALVRDIRWCAPGRKRIVLDRRDG